MNTPHRSAVCTPRLLRREKTNLSNGSSENLKEPVRVFCRLRPLKSENDVSCISLVSPEILSLTSPMDPKYGSEKELHCQFKQIFTSFATQKEIFDFVALPLLQDLLQGKNALLFSYGVTGSGKTFTFSGEPNNPGLMPRCIDTIFNSIGDFQAEKFTVKPDRMNGFEIQSANDAIQDRLLENRANARIIRGYNKRTGGDQLHYVNDGIRLNDVNETNLFAVFVSYVEIYNNTVYDLLDESSNKVLQTKILREDLHKNVYVNGVVEIEVKSAEEAFEVLNAGKKRKRMGNTLLNSESSRSHSIFTIRLVQIEQVAFNDEGTPIVPDCNVLKIAQFSLVDLAGSERTNRTQNTGMRLKEAGRINNSLMCLRNCMEILRENQLTGSNKLVPYRDSRLTYLFKNFFEGYGKVEMIVCVNPSVDDYEENLQVMKFAEMTQDVKIKKHEHKDTPYVQRTNKRIANTPSSTSKLKYTSYFSLPKIPTFTFDPDNFDQMGVKMDQIAKALKHRSLKVESHYIDFNNKEKRFRKHLCEMNENNILINSEVKSLKGVVNKAKHESYDLKNKITDLETVNDSLASKNDELQDVIRSLRHTIDEKDLQINKKILEKEKTKQKFVIANEKMNQELDDKLRRQREHLQATMQAKENKLKKVKEILESDDPIVEQKEVIAPKPKTPAPPTPLKEIHTSCRRNNVTPSVRRRRSRSAGAVWLEHNSIKPVPLDTVLQPSVKKRKSLTKLTKVTDITNPKQSKYCLIAQDRDNGGELETKVYKGDILPTCGGGAQVVFNDLELLTQRSPTATP